jgi:hypothetical protein
VNGRAWSKSELRRLRHSYPRMKTESLARALGRPLSGVRSKANDLGLKKSPAYLGAMLRRVSTKLKESGRAHRFPKGHVPANKGLRRPGWAPGRMRETQFKKGRQTQTWVPIGTEVIDDGGYLKRKVSDDRAKPSRFNWRHVHVLLWETAHGPVPPGYALKFIDDNRSNVVLNNLCLVSRADLARLNVMWNRYPRALCEVIQLRGALNRRINRRTKDEKQHRRSA